MTREEKEGLLREAVDILIKLDNHLMTSRDKIKILKSKMDGHTDTSYEWAETVRMAIKALEQEPTDENLHREREQAYMQGYEDASKRFRQEPCENAISRQAVLELIADYDLSMGQVVKGIHALPSVTPQEPKTGHWIANAPQYDMLNPQYICSECGNAHTRTTPYCEMCGAKMVEPQEREDT